MVDTASEWEERRKHNPFLAQTKYLDLNMKLLSIGKKIGKKRNDYKCFFTEIASIHFGEGHLNSTT